MHYWLKGRCEKHLLWSLIFRRPRSARRQSTPDTNLAIIVNEGGLIGHTRRSTFRYRRIHGFGGVIDAPPRRWWWWYRRRQPHGPQTCLLTFHLVTVLLGWRRDAVEAVGPPRVTSDGGEGSTAG